MVLSFSFTADFFAKALGSNRTYQTYKAITTAIDRSAEKQVLAYRVMGCSVSDTVPFYQSMSVPGRAVIFAATRAARFQDSRISTQVEYRRELKYRLGVVGFAGVGGRGSELGQI